MVRYASYKVIRVMSYVIGFGLATLTDLVIYNFLNGLPYWKKEDANIYDFSEPIIKVFYVYIGIHIIFGIINLFLYPRIADAIANCFRLAVKFLPYILFIIPLVIFAWWVNLGIVVFGLTSIISFPLLLGKLNYKVACHFTDKRMMYHYSNETEQSSANVDDYLYE